MRVIVADDSVLFREGLVRVLRDHDIDVVDQVSDHAQLMKSVETNQPQVAVVDIKMPPTHTDEGLRAAEEIKERWPAVAVLLLSQYVEAGYALKLMNGRGGVGYLLKDRVSDLDRFVSAVRTVGEGGSVVDPGVVTTLLERRRIVDPLASLTGREREILSLMAEGRSNRAICSALYVSPKTVETHVSNLFAKLGLQPMPDDHRRVLAVLTYLRSS